MLVFKVKVEYKSTKESLNGAKYWEKLLTDFNKKEGYKNLWLPDFIEADCINGESSISIFNVKGCKKLIKDPEKVLKHIKKYADTLDQPLNGKSELYLPEEVEYTFFSSAKKSKKSNKFKTTPTAIFKVHTENLPAKDAFIQVEAVREQYDKLDLSRPSKIWIPDDLMDIEFIESNIDENELKQYKVKDDPTLEKVPGKEDTYTVNTKCWMDKLAKK